MGNPLDQIYSLHMCATCFDGCYQERFCLC